MKYQNGQLKSLILSWNFNQTTDYFRFTFYISKIHLSIDTDYLISFDISSLFTSINWDESIVINELLNIYIVSPVIFLLFHGIFLWNGWNGLLSVSLGFNNMMYWQVDGISMSSSLGLLMADIFAEFQEKHLFDKVSIPYCYSPYVDNTFASITSYNEINRFFQDSNCSRKNFVFLFGV